MSQNRPAILSLMRIGMLACALCLAPLLAEAHGTSGSRGGDGGRGGDRDGRSDGRSNGGDNRGGKYDYNYNKNYNNGYNNDDDDDDKSNSPSSPTVVDTSEKTTSTGGKGTGSSGYSAKETSYEDYSKYAAKQAHAQEEYYAKVANYYKVAAAKSLALGVVATAEGLGKKDKPGIEIGEGDGLIATGLNALKAGEEMKQTEQNTLDKIQATASAKMVDEELMADPLADEVIEELVRKTGYSKAEVIEKILNSKGSLDALAEEFEEAARRRERIDAALLASQADLEAQVEGSKAGALRRKINFASLREALTTSATVAKKAAQPDWKKQWAVMATTQVGVKPIESSAGKQVAARAPASTQEFLNLGENLPSFELEESQSEEAQEPSLFEKVHRKYIDIAPSMWRAHQP